MLERPGTATIAAVASLAALALLRFNNIGKLKALGLELESATRDAHEVTEEAKATVVQLRALSAMVGKLELDNLALRNRLGVLPPRKLLAIRDELCETLRIVGCSDREIARAQELLLATVRTDLGGKIISAAWENVSTKEPTIGGPTNMHDVFIEKTKPLMRQAGTFSVAAPAEFRRVLGGLDALSEDVVRRIEEFEEYERAGEVPSYAGDANYLDLRDLG